MTLETDKLNILVIEDNPGDALLLEEYLRMTELRFESIMHASHLAQGLRMAEEKMPDLVFLDLSLPDSRGIESFSLINERLYHVPVIILSGLNDNSVTLDAISAGAQDYLVKGDLSAGLLQKSVLYSIERKKTLENVRMSNERFNALSTASQDSIWDWNLRNGDFYCNDAMSKTLGYSKEDISRGYVWWYENLHKDDRQKANNRFQKALIGGEDNWQHEYRFVCADGTVKQILGRGIILKDTNGNPYRLIGIMQDITTLYQLQQKLANEQINKQRELAQATIDGQEKERTELGKELHDNINQLLAATKLYLNVATTKPEVKDEMISRSINNLNYCMEEIRKLSKALVPPSIGLINLSEALHDLIDTVQVVGALEVDSYVSIDTGLMSNKQQLNIYRIVQEQLNNIIKHAGATKATIHVQQENDTIELIIKDNGKGFDTGSKYEGIGLKNIQNRAELLNGKMSIDSRKDNGCTLKISFPSEIQSSERTPSLVSQVKMPEASHA